MDGMDENSLRLLVAQGVSVEQIGRRFGKNPSTVSYWMQKFGLESPNREKHAAKGGIERGRLEELVAAGLSIAQIADEVDRSKGTVGFWLRKYGLKTLNRNRRASRPEATAAREAGLLTVTMQCPVHGETEFSMEGRGYYRCKGCRSEAVTKRRRRVKATLVAEAGGGCAICGYSSTQEALAFHHLDPTQKRMHISADGKGVAIDELRAEARKCVLLCHNCHAEVECGAAVLPIQ
jgi:transposase